MNASSPYFRYLWALLSVAAAVGFRLALQPWMGSRSPYAMLFLAVLCSAIFAGWVSALIAALLGAAAAVYLFIEPLYSFGVQGGEDQLSLALYLSVSAATIVLVEAHRRARSRAERAEAAERVHREWLEVTLASIGDAVIVTDTEGRIAFMNPGAAAITGWTVAEAAGQPVQSVFNIRNEAGAAVENPAVRAIRDGRVVGLANHTVLTAKDGRRIPIDDSGAPMKNAAGKVIGAVLVFRDVSSARTRQAELRERDRMIESSHDAIIVADAQRRILRWNTGACELYGWEEAEAKGQVMHELLTTDGELPVRAIDEILKREGRWDGRLTHTCRNGRTIVVESRQVLLCDAQGEPARLLEINRDITDRIEAEEGRRTLETLMRYIPEGIALADAPDVRIRMISHYGVDLLGRPREMLANITAADQPEAWGIRRPDGMNPATPEELPLTRAVRDGEVITDEEWALARPDGSLLSVVCNAGPIRDGQGQITGGLIAWRDITQRKRLEEKMQETARLESVGVLAGGIAHDFNNLLTGILGNASLLVEDTAEGTSLHGFARGILHAAERAARLTQQMLAYSGRGRFVIEPLDLSELIRETATLIQSSIPKNVELRLDLDDHLPLVDADLAQLQQLVMNLVVNGGEAIPQHGGRLSVTTRAQRIDAGNIASLTDQDSLKPGLFVVIEVQDTGCGMDERTMARIFDPFFTTKFTGRGLGLAAVQGIVRGHRGAITVYSAPGAGTTFRILLPAGEHSHVAAAVPEERGTGPAFVGAGTILVVDDEEVVRSIAKAALEKLGFTVVLASGGEEAVHVFRTLAPQIRVVILDMTMAGMSGEETLRELRGVSAAVPVILSSGFTEMEALRRFAGARLSGFLQKPYSVRALAEKVRAATSATAASSGLTS